MENGNRDLHIELSELLVQHIKAISELDKTRSVLRVQGQINTEQKWEVEALQARLGQIKAEFQAQLESIRSYWTLSPCTQVAASRCITACPE